MNLLPPEYTAADNLLEEIRADPDGQDYMTIDKLLELWGFEEDVAAATTEGQPIRVRYHPSYMNYLREIIYPGSVATRVHTLRVISDIDWLKQRMGLA